MSADPDGITFLRHETRPVTYAVFHTGNGEIRLSKSKTELRQLALVTRGEPCPETDKALNEWPTKGNEDV